MITDGVKSGQGCEGVTVGALRVVAPAARTVANLVPAGSNCFLGVSCALLSRLTSTKHRFRASNSRNGQRQTAGTDICVVLGASGARAWGASLGRSVWRLQPTSTWPQVPPMRFLCLTEYNVGIRASLDVVSRLFDTMFTFTPHPISNAHDRAVSGPHPPRGEPPRAVLRSRD
jgi:hypothetical protein